MTPQYCALQCNSYATAGGCWLTAVRQQAMSYSTVCCFLLQQRDKSCHHSLCCNAMQHVVTERFQNTNL